MDVKVMYHERLKEDKVRCKVCPHNCLISEDKFGICRIRTVKNNEPVAINYGEVTSISVDPIEKKPLYHFKPSKNILSLGSFGCNMTCSFCQNYEISQYRPKSQYLSIDKLIELIGNAHNNAGVAFTYNEPFMWYEYIYEAAKKIKEYNKDINVVIVTNGYLNEEPLFNLLPYVDAMNIDLKGYTNKYYKDICGAKLDPVLETIKRCHDKCHIEITTLLVRDHNDSIEEVTEIAKFLSSINNNIPLHLSRYFPRFKMQNEATEIKQIEDDANIAREYLKHVYIGNVQGVDNNTYCKECGNLLIERNGYIMKVHMKNNKCSKCSKEINIIL